jgi:glyoxylase-like metal-dependent hydrolase (beta-lactamase superfamily II)
MLACVATFALDGVFASSFDLSFSACAGVYLGIVDAGHGSISGEGIDGPYEADTSGSPTDRVVVTERTPGVTTTPLTAEDNIVLFDHITQSNDHDSATFEVKTEPGIIYEITLFPPPGAAFDLLAFGPKFSAAGFTANGYSPNGLSPNGLSPNGLSPNGLSSNGFSPNGLSPNGLSPNGLSPNGLSWTRNSEVLDDLPLQELAPPDSTGVYASNNRGDQPEKLYIVGNHGDEGVLTVSTEHLVMEGSRRMGEWASIREHIPSMDAVLTPGHRPGHYFFADKADGLLFAGDHVLPTITPSIGFTVPPAEDSLGDFMRSLAKVRSLPDLQVLPAHGPVAPSAHARVDELLAHHEHRLDLCLKSLGERGTTTAHVVAQDLGWTRHEKAYDELDLFSQGMASMETKAHLELLVARGELTEQSDPEGIRYTASA